MEASDLSIKTRTEADEQEFEILIEAARRATWDALHGPTHLRSGSFRPRPQDREVGSRAAARPPEAAQQDDAPDGASRRR